MPERPDVLDAARRGARRATPLLRHAADLAMTMVRTVALQLWAAMVTAEATPVRHGPPSDTRRGRIGRLLRLLIWPVAALVLMAITVDDLSTPGETTDYRTSLAALLSVLPLVARHRAPLAAFRLSLLCTIVAVGLIEQLLTGVPVPLSSVFVVPLCAFAAVDRARQDIAVGVVASGVVTLVVIANVVTQPQYDEVWVTSAAVLAATVVFASTVRSRRQAQGALLVEESRTAAQQAARAVLEERTRIARELHDVVAHHMSAIAIQAEAAPLRAAGDAAALTAELGEIRRTALDSMREMRRILGVLREESEAPTTAPAPGLDDLDALVSTARAAGLTVHTEMLGAVVPLPPTVSLSAYRIIQESLANAMKHAPGSTVAIAITYRTTPAVLAIDVHSSAGDGSPAFGPSVGAPHGLTGMRERVSMLGGDLSTGPSADGGFLVQARLPLDAT